MCPRILSRRGRRLHKDEFYEPLDANRITRLAAANLREAVDSRAAAGGLRRRPRRPAASRGRAAYGRARALGEDHGRLYTAPQSPRGCCRICRAPAARLAPLPSAPASLSSNSSFDALLLYYPSSRPCCVFRRPSSSWYRLTHHPFASKFRPASRSIVSVPRRSGARQPAPAPAAVPQRPADATAARPSSPNPRGTPSFRADGPRRSHEKTSSTFATKSSTHIQKMPSSLRPLVSLHGRHAFSHQARPYLSTCLPFALRVRVLIFSNLHPTRAWRSPK